MTNIHRKINYISTRWWHLQYEEWFLVKGGQIQKGILFSSVDFVLYLRWYETGNNLWDLAIFIYLSQAAELSVFSSFEPTYWNKVGFFDILSMQRCQNRGVPFALPIFGRSVNPIPTGKGRLCPPITNCTLKNIHLPASLDWIRKPYTYMKSLQHASSLHKNVFCLEKKPYLLPWFPYSLNLFT